MPCRLTVSCPTSYNVVFGNIYAYSLQWLNHCGRAYEDKIQYVDMTSAVFVLNEVASYADVRPTRVRKEALRTSGHEANTNENSDNNNPIFIQENPSV